MVTPKLPDNIEDKNQLQEFLRGVTLCLDEIGAKTDEQVTVSNGTLCTDLNADKLDGYHATDLINQLQQPSITHMAKSGHNVMAIVCNGKLYTTSGVDGNYWVTTTGRHMRGPTHYGVDNFKIVPIPQSEKIKKVGEFVHNTFVLLENGNIYTWGYNNYGVCGLGHTNTVATPTLAATGVLDAYSHPSQGEYEVSTNRTFILKSDGLYATGYNAFGQCGVGDTSNKSSFTKCTVFTSSSQIKKVFPIGCTYGFTFVLTTAGKIYFAGRNNTGVAGDGTTTDKSTFTDVTNAWAGVTSGVQDIKVTGGSRCYDTGDGGSMPWAIMLITKPDGSKMMRGAGHNGYGQLGDGTTTNRTSPVQPLNVPQADVIDIAGLGASFGTLNALCSNGDMWAWGYNGYGQVGDGATTNRTTPSKVQTGVLQLYSNGMTSHTYGYATQSYIRKSDGLYACGMNDGGYCGLGHVTSPVTTHTRVKLELASGEYVTDIGHYTTRQYGRITIALTNKSNLFAWGYNVDYGVGGNTTNNVIVPLQFRIQEVV